MIYISAILSSTASLGSVIQKLENVGATDIKVQVVTNGKATTRSASSKQLLPLLQPNEEIDAVEAAKRSGLTHRQASNALYNLSTKKLLKRVRLGVYARVK